MRLTNLATSAVGVLLILGAGCDGSMTPLEADDAGNQAGSFNNVNGYCSSTPASCDDLVQDGDDEPTSCCFGNQMYTCIGGELKYKDCPDGCYNSADGTPHCLSSSSTGDDPGGWQDPPTDPGPGF